jgi:hypothetical protein
MRTSKSDLFKINVTNAEACKSSLLWFRAYAQISSDGARQMTLDSLLRFLQSMVADEILLNYISIEPEIPEGAKRRAISLAITRWLRYKRYAHDPDPVQSFKEALAVELRSIERKKREYEVLVFLNLNPERFFAINPLSIRGYQLRFLTWNELGNLNVAKLWKAAQTHFQIGGQRVPILVEREDGYHPKYLTFTPVLLPLKSYSPRDALSVAVEQIDLFRATLNFVPATRLMVRYGYKSPICKFLPSPIYGVFDSQGDLLLDAYSTENYRYIRQEKVSEQEFEAVTDLIEKINAQNEGLLRLFVKLLYLYQQALDFTDHRATFLALWQVLEAAVLDKPDQRISVEKHLAKLIQTESDPLLNQALTLLAHRRNSLVHFGIFPEYTNDLVFALKKFVDSTLFRILELSKDLSNEMEFQKYLNHITVNDVDLARRRKVIELIQDTREGD